MTIEEKGNQHYSDIIKEDTIEKERNRMYKKQLTLHKNGVTDKNQYHHYFIQSKIEQSDLIGYESREYIKEEAQKLEVLREDILCQSPIFVSNISADTELEIESNEEGDAYTRLEFQYYKLKDGEALEKTKKSMKVDMEKELMQTTARNYLIEADMINPDSSISTYHYSTGESTLMFKKGIITLDQYAKILFDNKIAQWAETKSLKLSETNTSYS